ncbi:single-stranded DNA-binding protein [Occultella glacieicola]|uniref:Single-stranded DNA-binding protein n=1 Tax=Occultella glacieicola TaxID=2518684 RepID=A0ABY2E1F7_9MICO|nr:single-stranded DNA-binding protein [Occultella glacieicola]TDE88168.1 single-stranded DNA-binding protein [Occultella glacieicola]
MSTITIAGNLTEDPTIRYTPSGRAVANLRVLENTGHYDRDAGKWVEDPEPNAFNVTVWGDQAENVAESLHKGDAVVGYGTITTNSYETAQGERRTSQVITADVIGASLRRATATVTRKPRKSENQD